MSCFEQIQVNFHIIFWADTIRVRYHEPDMEAKFIDLFSLEAGYDDDTADFKGDELCENPIGSASRSGNYDAQVQMNCELVRILDVDTSVAKDHVLAIYALLILEENGIAKRVGQATIDLKLYNRLPWKQRLIVLG